MKALMKYEAGFGNMRLADIAEPVPDKGQVKIKVMAAGICGTDLLIWQGQHKVSIPLVPGHEFSGIVVEVGEGVTGIKIGDRVTTETTLETCGTCDYCKTKDYNICSNRKGLGTHVNGGFAQYAISRQESVHIIPENVDFVSAALTEPLACGVHAVMEKSGARAGDIAVVFGPGTIGLLTAQVAKAAGVKVIIAGISKDTTRLELAGKVGIDYVINSDETDLKSFVLNLTNGYGADLVFECSGSHSAVKLGIDILRKKGQYVQMGLFANPQITINADNLVHRELNIIGSRSQKPSSWITALELLKQGKVNTKLLATSIFPIEEWETAFVRSQNGDDVKAILYPNERPEF
ncbi:MAG: L-iditol 2-dehydrogenase [Tepidanaerobacteraceae bacterium]|jgi:L-iditol 2-dehydrogenase|nr:L-iditol 2-dehydrogenase [Tepidanaerobacteraceae bacterium]